MKRPLSALLAFALFAGTPGLPAWQALAATAKANTAGAGGNTVPGGQAGAQAGAPGASALNPVQLQQLSLTGTPPLLSLPAGALAPLDAPRLAAPAAVSGAAALPPAAAPAGSGLRNAPAAAPVGSGLRSAPAAPAAVLSAPNDGRTPSDAGPGAAAVPAAAKSEKQIVAALEEAGRRLGEKDADQAAILSDLYKEGVGDGELSGIIAGQERKAGPRLSPRARAALRAYAQARSIPLPQRVAEPSRLESLRDLVLLREFNASERSYLVGQAIFLTAISVYLATLPLMVHALTGDVALLGQARAVHYWTFAAASLFAGGLNKRLPLKTALTATSAARAVIFGAIGVLTVASGLPFAGFLVLAAASAAVASLSHLNDTDAGGPAKVFGSNDKIERANYMYSMVKYGLLLTVPPLLGYVMQHLFIPVVGEAATAGVGYILFAALMAVAAYVYRKDVVGLNETLVSSPLRAVLREAALGFAGSLRGFAAYPARAGRAAAHPRAAWLALKAWARPGLELFDYMRRKPAISTRASMTVVEQFAEDALFNVVIPSFAFAALGLGVFGSGLMTAALTAGGLVASTMMVGWMKKAQARYGVYRVIQGLSLLAALAFIPTIGLWAAPSIWLALPAVFFLKLMLQPMNSRMGALLQTELNSDAEGKKFSDGVWSVITILEVAAAGLGAVVFSALLSSSATVFGAPVAMVSVTGLMLVLGVLYLFTPRLLRDSLEARPARVTVQAPPDSVLKGEAERLQRLSSSLEAAGLPPLKTAFVRGPDPGNEPVVVVLAPGSTHKVAINREIGRQHSGAAHHVLDPSWLEREDRPMDETHDGPYSLLFVRKAVVYDDKGQATLVEYETPRPAGKWGDWFTMGANGTDEGVPYESDSAVSMSSSRFLEQEVNDKLLTRAIMQREGAARTPKTVALGMPGYSDEAVRRYADGEHVKVGALPTAERDAVLPLRARLDAFLAANHHPDKKVRRKVVLRLEGASAGGARASVDRDSIGTAARLFELIADEGAPREGVVRVDILASDGMRAASLELPYAGLPWAAGGRSAIRDRVNAYLDGYEGKEVVVKPSGPQFHSGYGVGIYGVSRRAVVIGHFLALASDGLMTDDSVLLLDQRVDSAPIYREGRLMETTLRVLVSRFKDAGFVTEDVFARVGPRGLPTTAEPPSGDVRDAASVEDWNRLLGEWRKAGLLNEAGARALDAEVRGLGPKVFAAWDKREKERAAAGRASGEPWAAKTDLIGLDVMIELQRDADGLPRLVPYVIEINDHDAGGQHNLDFMRRAAGEPVGEHSRRLAATWIQDARRARLEGKRIVVVGAGYRGKKFVFETYKRLKVKTVLVSPRDAFVDELLREGLLDEYIEADNARPKEALASVRKKLLRSARKNGKLDGITSHWEDDVPFTAMLARSLKLRYHSVEAANAVRSKSETRRILNEAGVSRVPVFKLRNPLDADEKLRSALRREFLARLEEIGFPAVLKPVFGAAAIGPKRIDRLEDALRVYDEVRSVVRPEVDPIFAQGTDLQVEAYLDGQEYDIDILMMDGEVTAATVTDNKPTLEPYFQATGSVSPSRGMTKAQQKEAVAQAAAAAKALGLTDGVLHIEGKFTSRGPRIIEANGRMGGEYVADWNKTVWGLDLVEEGAMIAAGIRGRPFVPERPLAHLDGDFIMTPEHGVVSELSVDEAARSQPGFHAFTAKFSPGDRVAPPLSGTNRLGMIVAKGATAEEAAENLRRLKSQVRVRVLGPSVLPP